MSSKTQLTKLTIDELSLVDDGANPEAHVAIVKAKKGVCKEMPCPTCKSPAACKSAGGCANESEPDGDEGGKGSKVGKAASVVEKMREVINEMAPDIAGRVAKAFPNDHEAADLVAALLTENDMNLEELTKALEEARSTIEAQAVELAKAKSERDEAVAKAKGGKTEEDDVLKALPEHIRKRFDDIEKTNAAQAAVIEKMATDREEAEFIEKAKGFKIGDAKIIGPLMRRIEKGLTTAEDAKTVEELLKSAGAQAETSNLFKSAGAVLADGANPDDVLKAKADEIKKANPKLTHEQAYSQALTENPQAYDAYVAKRRNTIPSA